MKKLMRRSKLELARSQRTKPKKQASWVVSLELVKLHTLLQIFSLKSENALRRSCQLSLFHVFTAGTTCLCLIGTTTILQDTGCLPTTAKTPQEFSRKWDLNGAEKARVTWHLKKICSITLTASKRKLFNSWDRSLRRSQISLLKEPSPFGFRRSNSVPTLTKEQSTFPMRNSSKC